MKQKTTTLISTKYTTKTRNINRYMKQLYTICFFFFSKHAKLITTAIKKNIKNKTKNLLNNYIYIQQTCIFHNTN